MGHEFELRAGTYFLRMYEKRKKLDKVQLGSIAHEKFTQNKALLEQLITAQKVQRNMRELIENKETNPVFVPKCEQC